MGHDADPVVVVLTTASDSLEAERLVEALVGERLVACGNIVPGATSIYRWQGATQRAAEALILLKTVRSRADAVFARVRELHSYEVPELVALPAEAVSPAYLDWIRQETLEVNA